MRPWRAVALALLLGAASAAAQVPDGPYFKVNPLRGHIACAASAATVSTDDACSTDATGGLQRFELPYDANLTAVLIEIDWTRASSLGPSVLRIEIPEDIDVGQTRAWEGGPRGRLWLQPIDEPMQAHGGVLGLVVVPSEATTAPTVVSNQPFDLAVTFLHAGATLPDDYSGLDADEPRQSSSPDAPRPEEAAPAELVPVEAGSWRSAMPWGLAFAGLAVAPVAAPRIRRALLAWGSLALFSRLDEDRLLEHPRRAELVALVRAEPGVAAESARARLDCGRGSFEHHLRILESRRLLRRMDVEGRVLLYPAEGPRPTPPQAVGLAARVLEAVRAEPGLRQVDLAARLAVHERTLRHHALWLARRGRLRLVSEGRTVRCFPVA